MSKTRKCRISTFGVIVGGKTGVYYGFRCAPHQLADGRRFGEWKNLKRAIKEHKESHRKKS